MYREAKPVNWESVRIAIIAVAFAAGTVLLLASAYRLQVSKADLLRNLAEKQRTRVLKLEARRGMILDRSGEQMAASLEVNSIYARPREIKDKKRTAEKIAHLLEIDPKETLSKLREDKAFVWMRRRVSPLMADRVKQADLRGVSAVKEYQRFYPLKSFAAHAMGFAGIDSRGLEGLELYYDGDLKADPIPVTAQSDAMGRPVIFAAIGRNPKRKDLHLTLDRNIQYVAEKELEEAVSKAKAKDGTVIVMDVDSGEVLALASRPTYNLNVFRKTSAEVRRNRAVADTFEPGSTFKVFLAAAVVDLARVSPSDKFNCQNGIFRYKGAQIHDVVPHKELAFADVIIRSSNIGAVKVSERLTKSEFYRILKGFGFGSSTEVDLPGERHGFLPLPGKWSVLTKANIAFGQGIAVNPLQLTTAFCAAVNGGKLYRPHLMKRIANALGETVRENPPVVVRRVIKPSTSREVVDILRQVVEKGTGKAAKIPGVYVIGKTGTAQKADPSGGYSKDKYVSSFLGALMDVKPRLAILVMIDEPAVKHRTGGQVAAPVFRKIAEGILALCGGKPTEPRPIVASAGQKIQTAPPVRKKSIPIRKGPRAGEWIVPDLKGLDMRRVLDLCAKMKCDASFHGTGIAVGQDPVPGKILKEGDPLKVSFKGRTS